MKSLLAFFALLFFTKGLAQDKINLKLCPLALIDDASFPTIQGGLEWRLSKKISWYNELGLRYRKSYFEDADTALYASRGLKAKSEIRYYFFEKQNGALTHWPESYYVAANLFYTRDVHSTAINYYAANSTTESTDNFGVKKNIFGMNLLAGAQISLSKKFMLDVYGGIGLKTRHIATSYQEYIHGRDKLINSIDITIQGVRNWAEAKGGTSTVPNLTAGLRLCWQL